MDEELKYYIWLQGCFGLNPSHFPEALRRFGSAEGIFSASPEQCRQSGIFSEAELSALSDKDLSRAGDIIRSCRENGISVCSYSDPVYPRRLQSVNAPPVVLYVLGRLAPEDVLSVGIVGTRYPFEGYRSMAYSFSAGLVRGGAAVISGGAIGIDRAAHLGATENEGRTVCVLGCGINRFTVKDNRELCRSLLENGAIVSEYPPDMPAAKYTFPMRNRIISGMSDCVLVVQAGTGSGSLITARAALRQKRKLFIVPGTAYSERCGGNNALIRAGFSVALDHEDIFCWAQRQSLLPEDEPNPPVTPEITRVLSKRFKLTNPKRESGKTMAVPPGYTLSLMLKNEGKTDTPDNTKRRSSTPFKEPASFGSADSSEEITLTDKGQDRYDNAADSRDVHEETSPEPAADEPAENEQELRSLIGEALANEAAMLPGTDSTGGIYPKLPGRRSTSGIIGQYDRMYKNTAGVPAPASDAADIDSRDESAIEQLLQQLREQDGMQYSLPPTLDFVSEDYRSFLVDLLRYRLNGASGPYDFMNKEYLDALFLPKDQCLERLSGLMDDPRLKNAAQEIKAEARKRDPLLSGIQQQAASPVNQEKSPVADHPRKRAAGSSKAPTAPRTERHSVKINKSDKGKKGENDAKKEKLKENTSKRLTEAARAVYDTFSDTSMSIDSIILGSGLAVNVVMAAVTELQAAGMIVTVPGGKFMKS